MWNVLWHTVLQECKMREAANNHPCCQDDVIITNVNAVINCWKYSRCSKRFDVTDVTIPIKTAKADSILYCV